MNKFKPGDVVIYVGKPTDQLNNGVNLCIEDIDGDEAIIMDSDLLVPLVDLFQLRDFNHNDDVADSQYHDQLYGSWYLPMGDRSKLLLRGT